MSTPVVPRSPAEQAVDAPTAPARDITPSGVAGLLERPMSRREVGFGPRRRLWGRPELYTAYEQDMALLNTPGKKLGLFLLLAFAVAVPWFAVPARTVALATAIAAGIGAIGLNIVTGYAGQVSLGHAFFLGIGAFTAATISGPVDGRTVGFGITNMIVWLLAAGLVAALAGLVVSPLAFRLKGLYLAIVTLGLVILGDHLFKEFAFITGGPGVGRKAATPELFGFRFDQPHELLGIAFTRERQLYLLMLGMLVLFAVIGRNLARSDLGRAFSAVRDRDIAAEVIGVNLMKAKALAFTISSFYAGVTGALLYTVSGFIEPGSFSLLLSIQYIAMILIGGIATISGSIMGAMFIMMLGSFTRVVGPKLGFLTGFGITPEVLEAMLYGILIIGFLIIEPRGLYGIWVRIRNYWKGWPFSY